MSDQVLRGLTFRMLHVSQTDSSAVVIGDLDELDSAIVACLSHPMWSQVWVMTMLALLAGVDCHNISDIALMWDSCDISHLLF